MTDKAASAETAATTLADTDLWAIEQGSADAYVSVLLMVATVLARLRDTDGTFAANSDSKFATQKATATYVAAQITARLASADVMIFKGAIDCSANPNYPAADAGAVYIVSVAGKIGGASGTVVEAGDLAVCKADATAGGTQAAVGASWDVVQTNITFGLDTDGTMAANSDAVVPSQKAVRTYVAAAIAALSTGGVRAVTGTTDTMVTADRGKLVTYSNAAAIAVALPQAGSTGFPNTWFTHWENLGAGAATFTPATSTINGAATLVLTTGQGALVFSDGTNYSAIKVGAGTAGAGGDIVTNLVNAEGAISGATTIATFGTLYRCVDSGSPADYTVNLPAVSGNAGKVVGIRLADTMTKIVTLTTVAGSPVINGLATRRMIGGEAAILLCDGSNWVKIGGRSYPLVGTLRQGATQAIANATMTQCSVDNAATQTNVFADATNKRFTILRDGIYEFTAQCWFNSLAVTTMLMDLFKNGASVFETYGFSPSSSYNAVGKLGPVSLNLLAGDVVDLRVFQNSGGSATLYGAGTLYTFFSATEKQPW